MDDSKVAILLEDLRNQFQVFGEGLQMLRDKMDHLFEQNRQEHKLIIEQNQREHRQIVEQNRREHRQIIEQNRQEHKLMMQMTQELNHDFRTESKRVK